MTREQRIAEARRLRGEGLTYPAIAARLGVSKSTVRRWVNPADAEKEARWEQIEKWWAEGLDWPTISERLGVSYGHLAVEFNRMRRAGRNLPYRYRGYSKYGEEKVA